MKNRSTKWLAGKIALLMIFIFVSDLNAFAATLDTIGVTLLRAVTTNVDGGGITVAQPEASLDSPGAFTIWEVNPASVDRPASIFTYASSNGTASVFPNSLGSDSSHADGVGGQLYGIPNGIATNVTHVDSLEANFFITDYVGDDSYPAIGDPIVNQSYTFGPLSVSDQQQIDSQYDNYSVENQTLFISAADNYGTNYSNSTNVCAPGTAYNCISVGAYDVTFQNAIGPTSDNGRCKPDITAPGDYTSDTTPEISGAAALLMQAALRGDGGADTNSADDPRTIKALLLNGAVKTADWTNSTSAPLDFRYGAGVLNVFNSYEQLVGDKNNFTASTTVTTGGAHPPNSATTSAIGVLNGWDFNTNTSGNSFISPFDSVNHYYFNVTNNLGNTQFTATLVWERHFNANYAITPEPINNLNLFLYNAANSNLVNCSTSLVDNVEHIYMTNLPAGRYDLQVWKAGGLNIVSAAEPYALAWEFAPLPTLTITNSGTNVALTWSVYPAGFLVESETNLLSSAWSTNNLAAPIFTNGLNNLPLNATNAARFFRLRAPNF